MGLWSPPMAPTVRDWTNDAWVPPPTVRPSTVYALGVGVWLVPSSVSGVSARDVET